MPWEREERQRLEAESDRKMLIGRDKSRELKWDVNAKTQ